MLDLKTLTADPEEYKKSFADRGGDPAEVDKVLAANDRRKKMIQKSETLKAQQNKINVQIAELKKNKQDASALLEEMKTVAHEVKKLEADTAHVESQVRDLLLGFPNQLHSSTPRGRDEAANKEVRRGGEPRKINFKAKEHWQLGEELGILDFERGARVTGARFTFVKSFGAKLERALINFMLDIHTSEHGYQEMVPPFIVNAASMVGTGQLPKFGADMFQLKGLEYFLIPTSEVPVTNYHREDILTEQNLPIAFTAYSPCFRAEAGSYGKDTKGLIRQHQFNKVEVVRFCHPTQSYEQLELLTSHAEKILQRLELPYRVMALSSGDIGFGSAKTYDLEVWLPGQNAYREISSCSNYEAFQARRANIRFKPKAGGKPEFVHTLNGSGLAVGRTLVAILENFHQEDGTIIIPEALRKYCGFDKIVKA